MDRARILGRLNGRVLAEYSRRTVQELRSDLPLRLVLPHLESLLALNLDKEVRKDAHAVACADAALRSGETLRPVVLKRILDAAKAIDDAFVHRIDQLPVRIVIPYDEITPLRARRMERLFDAAQRILAGWTRGTGLRAALAAAYGQSGFEQALGEILRLYAAETRVLSRSVRLPLPLVPLREHLARSVATVMSSVSTRLAKAVAAGIFVRKRLGSGR